MPPSTLLGSLQHPGTQISPWAEAAGSLGSRSPPAMPTPSFCQATSGRGIPLASQDSTALVLTITITTLGRDFKTGGSASSREALSVGGPAGRVE